MLAVHYVKHLTVKCFLIQTFSLYEQFLGDGQIIGVSTVIADMASSHALTSILH